MTTKRRWNISILEQKLSSVCATYGRTVARWPLPFLVFPCLLAAILSLGMLRLRMFRGAEYLFSPLNATSLSEEAVLKQYWGSSDDNFYPGKDVLRRKAIHLMAVSKDAGSVLRPKQAAQFDAFLDFIPGNTSFVDADSNSTVVSYGDVCLRWRGGCYDNSHAKLIAQIFADQQQVRFNVTFPLYESTLMSDTVDLSWTLGAGTANKNGLLLTAKSWLIAYQLRSENDVVSERSQRWVERVAELLGSAEVTKMTDLLHIYYFHSLTFNEELQVAGARVLPKFGVAFATLIVFAILCTVSIVRTSGNKFVIDWTVSKTYLAVAGLLSALFGIVSSIGVLSFCGLPFADVVLTMPFLAISIGIDDMFLQLACWQATDRRMTTEQRVETTLRHAAVSVTITSLTDALSFLAGALAPLPAVTLFCSYAALAIAFTYLYSMTFFIAVMVYLGRMEEANQNCLVPWLQTKDVTSKDLTFISSLFNVGSHVKHVTPAKVSVATIHPDLIATAVAQTNVTKDTSPQTTVRTSQWYERFFRDIYAPVLCHPISKVLAMIALVGYLIGASMGMSHIKVGFELKHLLNYDSQALKLYTLREQYYYDREYRRMQVVVNNPPDIWNRTERAEFWAVFEAFERTKFSEGRNSTEFWYLAYLKYLRDNGFALSDRSAKVFFRHLRPFLLTNDFYSNDIIWKDKKKTQIKLFRFSIGLLPMPTNEQKIEASFIMRGMAHKHHKYNLTTYTISWPLVDQFVVLLPQTIKNVAIALVCMVAISLLLIPEPLCSIVVAATILSVDLGVVGYMSCTPNERVGIALGTLGWPVTQGALSTILGILVLATVDTYVVRTCFKTVFLVIIFGTVHALVFLPVLLSLIHGWSDYLLAFCNCKRQIVPVE